MNNASVTQYSKNIYRHTYYFLSIYRIFNLGQIFREEIKENMYVIYLIILSLSKKIPLAEKKFCMRKKNSACGISFSAQSAQLYN